MSPPAHATNAATISFFCALRSKHADLRPSAQQRRHSHLIICRVCLCMFLSTCACMSIHLVPPLDRSAFAQTEPQAKTHTHTHTHLRRIHNTPTYTSTRHIHWKWIKCTTRIPIHWNGVADSRMWSTAKHINELSHSLILYLRVSATNTPLRPSIHVHCTLRVHTCLLHVGFGTYQCVDTYASIYMAISATHPLIDETNNVHTKQHRKKERYTIHTYATDEAQAKWKRDSEKQTLNKI